MRIAIVHDYLCGLGGAERVFQYICEEFTEADVYVLAYNPSGTYAYFSSREIRATWLNHLVRSPTTFRWSFPVATYVMESLDLSNYDLVLSVSATVAKYVVVPNGIHLCYCFIPTRALWYFDEYFGGSMRWILKELLPYLRRRDYAAAQRVDRFIAISETSRGAIEQFYNRGAEVIFCPIDLDRFHCSDKKNEHYLLVSRLEHWKRVDYAVEAFNQLGLPLRIIGTGKEEARLRSLARENIEFLGAVDDEILAREYAEARAVVFTPFLEYGLIPLEANASGTPVICYGKGGVNETLIPAGANGVGQGPPTAVFFYEQTAQSLIGAVRQFESLRFCSADLARHAAQWDVPSFKRKLRHAVQFAHSEKDEGLLLEAR